jgi:murein DD-endopeptidase MepM/ murein hydrolase activator NlpD
MRPFFLIGILLALVACAAPMSDAPAPPTATPALFATLEPRPAAPRGEETPTLTCPGCGETTLDPMRFSIPTPGARPISAWRPPLYPVPWALSPYDHFYFIRPIAADQVNWPLARYRYGGVTFGPGIVHTGVDIPADKGVSVVAAASGVVVWADWGFFRGTPGWEADPYGISVSIQHDFGYKGEPLFTTYAHLSDVFVVPGQWVDTGELIGLVGDTGYTTGPHLHLEVRVGQDTFYNTRNPELWIAPPQGWGVLVGRVLRPNGRPYYEEEVYVTSLETGQEWLVRTYGEKTVRPDPYYRENVVLGDLPAGRYVIRVPAVSRVNELEVDILPGRVTHFQMDGSIGFILLTPPPASLP